MNDLFPAGFWIRLGAFVIDTAFLFALDIMVVYSSGLRIGLPTRLAAMVVSTLYFGLTTGAWGQTFGKMVAGIVVVRDEDSGPIGFRRAFGRALAHFVSGFVLGMGYLVAAFTPRKRALHDYLARTRVVYPEPVPSWRKTAVISTGVVGAGSLTVFVIVFAVLMVRQVRTIHANADANDSQPQSTIIPE